MRISDCAAPRFVDQVHHRPPLRRGVVAIRDHGDLSLLPATERLLEHRHQFAGFHITDHDQAGVVGPVEVAVEPLHLLPIQRRHAGPGAHRRAAVRMARPVDARVERIRRHRRRPVHRLDDRGQPLVAHPRQLRLRKRGVGDHVRVDVQRGRQGCGAGCSSPRTPRPRSRRRTGWRRESPPRPRFRGRSGVAVPSSSMAAVREARPAFAGASAAEPAFTSSCMVTSGRSWRSTIQTGNPLESVRRSTAGKSTEGVAAGSGIAARSSAAMAAGAGAGSISAVPADPQPASGARASKSGKYRFFIGSPLVMITERPAAASDPAARRS